MCLSDDGDAVQFQARAIQQIALYAHEKVATCSFSISSRKITRLGKFTSYTE